MTYLENFVTRQAALRVAGDASAIFPTRSQYAGREVGRGERGPLASQNAEDYARSQIKVASDMWDLYRGASGAAVNQRIADTFGTVRNLNVASKLGGATLSAVTDQGFQTMARYFAGVPMAGQIPEVVNAFRGATQREAVQAGLILDTAMNVMREEARWVGGMQGPAWSQYLADRVITWSGLSAYTQAGKHAFGLAIMAEVKNRAELAFAAMPERLRGTFERYGLTSADWDLIRAVNRDDNFLKPAHVYDALQASGQSGTRTAERYLEMILQETEYSTPEGTLQAKARAYGGLQKGTLRDEAIRSMGQFKMFGTSVALLQGQRIAVTAIQDGAFKGAGYAATLLVVSTLYGALAIQMKQIAAGKDPRPMDGKHGAKFWGAAMLQGGGAGIYGDFLSAETSRTGGGLARTVMGPTGDLAASVLSMTSGNMAEFMRGEKTNIGRESVRFLQGNTPGGSLWYLRAGYERAILDRLQREVDPEAYMAFRRKIDRARTQEGNDYWWRPGEPMPERGPQFSR